MGLIRRHTPYLFQSKINQINIFEGWYFKFSSSPHLQDSESCAFIPGISTDTLDSHAFIQYIDGHRAYSAYVRYPLSAFSYMDDPFNIQIGKSIFSKKSVTIDIDSKELTAQGSVVNTPWITFPSKFLKAGIMGPFGLLGFLECYHGIVSASHQLEGSVHVKLPNHAGNMINIQHNLNQGRGYIEKDWGKSFPKDYLWLQANNFVDPELSVFCSIASIPFKSLEFTGVIAFVHDPDGGFISFATWNGAKVIKFEHSDNAVYLVLKRKNLTLSIQAKHSVASPLFAPRQGSMDRVIKESVDAILEFELQDSGKIKLQGISSGAGFEIGGSLERLSKDIVK